MNKTFVLTSEVRYRYDIFGGLCWFPRGDIFQLNSNEIAIVDLLSIYRDIDDISSYYFNCDVSSIINKLFSINIIKKANDNSIKLQENDLLLVKKKIEMSSLQKINKPFWVHIQPFSFCNQKCIHCYCNAQNLNKNFPLNLDCWKSIVVKLKEIGIIDIYISGGENLIVDDCFVLTEFILSNGFGTGLSTNAMFITDEAIYKLKKIDIQCIQVSLDGGNERINDYIRGVNGAFSKTIDGIKKLSEIVEPIINTVVNKINISSLEDIVITGKKVGVKKFKFFPQKNVGRAIDYKDLLLTKSDIDLISIISKELIEKYSVDIEYPVDGKSCGAGFSGVSVDEYGYIYPCIFGIRDKKQMIGNIIHDDFEKIWFSSERLNKFRELHAKQPCNRCEEI